MTEPNAIVPPIARPTSAAVGFGIGLRSVHHAALEVALGAAERDRSAEIDEADVAAAGRIDWFEAISENYFGAGGNARRMLHAVRARRPVVLHGVSLSLGSVDPLDVGYLDKLQALVSEIEPSWVSDHLCWGGVDGRFAHDLLPLPYTEAALAHTASRIEAVQDRLKRPFVVENVSSYVAFSSSTMTEWEWIAALCRRTGCQVLLDVNNVFVSAHNHGFDADAFIAGIPVDAVAQIHLAGHSTRGALLLDTHDHPVRDGVWALYRKAVRRFGAVPTLIEWDDKIPALARVVAESEQARNIADAEVRASLVRSVGSQGDSDNDVDIDVARG
jgi:uncharacterized protein (UPF0276 family)